MHNHCVSCLIDRLTIPHQSPGLEIPTRIEFAGCRESFGIIALKINDLPLKLRGPIWYTWISISSPFWFVLGRAVHSLHFS